MICHLVYYIFKVSWLFTFPKSADYFGDSLGILREFFGNSSEILWELSLIVYIFKSLLACYIFKVGWCVMNWHHFREWGILNIRVCVCRSKSWQKSEIWLKGGQGQKWSLEALSWVLALKYWIADWYVFKIGCVLGLKSSQNLEILMKSFLFSNKCWVYLGPNISKRWIFDH